MPEPIGTEPQTDAIAEALMGRATALHRLFMRAVDDILANKGRSHRDVSRALKAQAQCRAALRLILALRATEHTTKKIAESNEQTIERRKFVL